MELHACNMLLYGWLHLEASFYKGTYHDDKMRFPLKLENKYKYCY